MSNLGLWGVNAEHVLNVMCLQHQKGVYLTKIWPALFGRLNSRLCKGKPGDGNAER